jgi:methionine aminopeptidase
MAIMCKSGAELEKMRRSGHIVRQVLEATRAVVAPGVSTMDLERVAEKRSASSARSRRSRDITIIPAFCALR